MVAYTYILIGMYLILVGRSFADDSSAGFFRIILSFVIMCPYFGRTLGWW